MAIRVDFFLPHDATFEIYDEGDYNRWLKILEDGEEVLTIFPQHYHPTSELEVFAPIRAMALHNHDWSDGILTPLTAGERGEIELARGLEAAARYRRWTDSHEERRGPVSGRRIGGSRLTAYTGEEHRISSKDRREACYFPENLRRSSDDNDIPF